MRVPSGSMRGAVRFDETVRWWAKHALASMLMMTASLSSAQMFMPTSLLADSSGAAVMSIPITAVPTSTGMEPKLALSYNSGQGNGLLGVGWEISGLSIINRCPQTKVHDGANKPLSLSATDRFCLDGQRLYAVTGNYGSDGARYRTELDGYTDVTSFGSTNGAPTYFQARTRGGLTMIYGQTSDSRVVTQDGTATLSWAINEVRDSAGNRMIVKYAQQASEGQFYPIRLEYGGNASAATEHKYAVTFEYQDRPDPITQYQLGNKMSVKKLLKRIRVSELNRSSGNVVDQDVRRYDLGYEASLSALTKRTRLSWVQLCDGAGAHCYPKTELAWTGSMPQYGIAKGTLPDGLNLGNPINHKIIVGDFTSDGLTDVVVVRGAQYRVLKAQKSGYYTSATYTLPHNWQFNSPTENQHVLGDFNGDGQLDFMLLSATSYHLMLGRGDGTFYAAGPAAALPQGVSGIPYSSTHYWLAYVSDFDENMSDDLFFYRIDRTSSSSTATRIANTAQTRLMKFDKGNVVSVTQAHIYDQLLAASCRAPNTLAFSVQGGLLQPGDYDGDGVMDFAVDPGNGAACGIPIIKVAADGVVAVTAGKIERDGVRILSFIGHSQASVFPVVMEDLNSDGLTDISFCMWDFSPPRDHVEACFGFNKGRVSGGDIVFDVVATFGDDLEGGGDTLLDLGGGSSAAIGAKGIDRYTFHEPYSQPGVLFSAPHGYLSAKLALDNGSAQAWRWVFPVSLASDFNSAVKIPVELNGDGYSDFLVILGNSYSLIMSATEPADLLKEVRMGPVAQKLTYKTMAQAYGEEYDPGVSTLPDNVRRFVAPIWLLTRMDTHLDGALTDSSSYRYGDLRVETGPLGRGLLGMCWMQETDELTGLTTRTEYRQDFPFIGKVSKVTKGTSAQNWSNLGETINELAAYVFNAGDANYTSSQLCAEEGCGASLAGPGKRFAPWVVSTTDKPKSWDERAGVAVDMPQSRVYTWQDRWANATMITVETLTPTGEPSGYQKTTRNVFAPADTVNWKLGRVLQTKVTHTSP